MDAKVRLLSRTHEPERVVARATDLRFSPLGSSDLHKALVTSGHNSHPARAISTEHLSLLEPAPLSFGVECALLDSGPSTGTPEALRWMQQAWEKKVKMFSVKR